MNTTTKILFALGAGTSFARAGFTPDEIQLFREIVEPATSRLKPATRPAEQDHSSWIGSVVRRPAALFGPAHRNQTQTRRGSTRAAA